MKSLKELIVIALALVIFIGSLGIESVIAGPGETQIQGYVAVVVPSEQAVEVTHDTVTKTIQNGTGNLQEGDNVTVKSGNGVEIHFADHGFIRLAQGTVIKLQYLDAQNDGFVFNLQQGRAWLNNLYTLGRLNVIAQGAYIIPDNAAVDVQIDDGKTLIYANRHQVSVGIVPLNFQPKSIKLFPDDEFINSYLLAEGNQTTVYADKITNNADTLQKLFYSKLVKEFPFGTIDPQLLTTDSWLQQNVKFDKAYETKIEDQFSQQIRYRGLKIADTQNTTGSALTGFYNFFTFSQSKVFDRTNDEIFDHFDDAKYLLLFGQTTKAKERLDYFVQKLDAEIVSHDDAYKATVLARLFKEYSLLVFVTPDDSLAQAKSALVTYLLKTLGGSDDDIRQKFLLVRHTMNSVYDLADKNSQTARQTLEDYFNLFTQVVNQEKTRLGKMRNILAEENQIMDNLLRNFPLFYRDRFFAMKYQLEQQWLALLPEGEGKNEEKQTIVSTKIDFLRQLKTFFLGDKIAVDDAKQIVFRLFHESDDLQLPADQQVAVSELYAKRLQDFGVFFRYLNSPEYVATTLHGASRKNQFDEYVQAQQEQVSIDEIRKEILGDSDVPTITPKMIVDQAQKDFVSAGIAQVVFGNYDDVSQKTLQLTNGVIDGYSIRALYEWDSKLLSQIYVGDTLISSDPVRLGNLELLIKTKMEPVEVFEPTPSPSPTPTSEPTPSPVPTPSPTPTPSPASASKTERVAKILLIQKLKAADIAIVEADIDIVDLSKSLFTVHKAILISDQSISFSFDVDGKNGVVTHLAVQAQDAVKTSDTSLSLGEVSDKVKTLYSGG